SASGRSLSTATASTPTSPTGSTPCSPCLLHSASPNEAPKKGERQTPRGAEDACGVRRLCGSAVSGGTACFRRRLGRARGRGGGVHGPPFRLRRLADPSGQRLAGGRHR